MHDGSHARTRPAASEAVVVTREGRRLLAARADQLRAQVLPELRAALAPGERDRRIDADYQQALDELRRLSWLVEHAADTEELPDDPERVELGELVTVRVEGGTPEQFLIVHPVEAPLDELRISAGSPLARALLGHRVGEQVTVAAPSGAYRCQILAAERVRDERVRDDAADDAAGSRGRALATDAARGTEATGESV